MPKIDPHQPEQEVTAFDRLDMKRKVFTYCEKHNYLYRDYGGWVAVWFPSHKPVYATTNKTVQEGADIDAAVHNAKYREQRLKESSRTDKKPA